MNITLIIADAVALIFGIWYVRITPDEVRHLQMLTGMFTGMGAAFFVMGLFSVILIFVFIALDYILPSMLLLLEIYMGLSAFVSVIFNFLNSG